ncbi:MAG: hypothetical protein AAF629_31785 [Chloroflexota bacterium]
MTPKLTIGLPWLGFVLLAIVTLSSLLPIQPNDYWWYVRLGQDIIETGTIPTVDHYSYTQADQPIVYHSWLSSVLFFVSSQVEGLGLTFLVRNLLLLVFYFCIWLCCRLSGTGPVLSGLLTLLAALAGSNNWAMRPQLFSFFCFGIALVVLWRWQQGETQTRWLWVLPVITIVWANLHGAFILIFLLAGAAFVGGGGNRLKLGKVIAAMVVASLITPRFVGSWLYVLTLLTDPPSQQLGAEWAPPINEGWQGNFFFAWLLLMIPLATFSPSKPNLTQWLWLLGFGWMALSGLRYVIWFLALLTPFTAQLLAPLISRWITWNRRQRSYLKFDVIFTCCILLLSLALLPGIRERWWPSAPPPLSKQTPIEATQWLAEHPDLAGPIWADLGFSSYFIYALPGRPVWIDTRFELYPLDSWQDYIAISTAASDWEQRLDQTDVQLLILDPKQQAHLLTEVEQSSHWVLRYQDDVASIYSRKGEE